MFYVYILTCRDGTFYTGYTNDVARRLAAHQRGVGGKYTRARRPVELSYVELCPDKSSAMRREWAIKQLTRQEKAALAAAWRPDAHTETGHAGTCSSPRQGGTAMTETFGETKGRRDRPLQPEKQLVQQQFSRSASAYVTSEMHADADKLAELVTWLAPSQDWITLDIATGGGHVAKALSPHVSHVFATDITPSMLRTAREHLGTAAIENVSFVVADAEDLPFLEDSFDAVTCRIAPHHFPDPQQFIREAARVLKPGGRFLLVDNIVPEDAALGTFYNHLEKLRDESHVRCASSREWETWMQAAGFTVVRSQERRKTFEFAPWVRRMARSEEQVEAVEQWLLQADETAAAFFAIAQEAGRVQSFQGLEWMALAQKGTN
jgi:ubiquinone/menaquinone biosynthesis C-methylase UbiE/predicted GIY-YIG superfamily endonuclease